MNVSALPFKDNLLVSQIPTWAFTLACTSDQFRSNWMSGPNHTLRMRTGPSYKPKGPGRVSLHLQAPSLKLHFFQNWPWLQQSARTRQPPSSQPLYPGGGIQNCDIIGERGNPCCKRASKRNTAQTRICPLIPKPTEQGFQSEDTEKRRQRAAPPDQTLDR